PRSPSRGTRAASGGEQRPDLLEETLREGVHLLAGDARELLEELALLRGELARRLHEQADDLVAPAVAVQVGHALPLQLEQLAGLRAGGDLELRGAFERRHVASPPEGRLGGAHGD